MATVKQINNFNISRNNFEDVWEINRIGDKSHIFQKDIQEIDVFVDLS